MIYIYIYILNNMNKTGKTCVRYIIFYINTRNIYICIQLDLSLTSFYPRILPPCISMVTVRITSRAASVILAADFRLSVQRAALWRTGSHRWLSITLIEDPDNSHASDFVSGGEYAFTIVIIHVYSHSVFTIYKRHDNRDAAHVACRCEVVSIFCPSDTIVSS